MVCQGDVVNIIAAKNGYLSFLDAKSAKRIGGQKLTLYENKLNPKDFASCPPNRLPLDFKILQNIKKNYLHHSYLFI